MTEDKPKAPPPPPKPQKETDNELSKMYKEDGEKEASKQLEEE